MINTTHFPDWTEQQLLPDTRFARAYDRTGDVGRAVLKSAIAELYALYPPSRITARLVEDHLVSGFSCRRETAPVAWVLLVVDHGYDAPVGLLAALMPALTSGAAEVVVARAGRRRFSDSCLAAMELCGQESVLELSLRKSRELVNAMLERREPGCILFLGGEAPALGAGAHACLHLAADKPLGVFRAEDGEAGSEFDVERLLFAQAGRCFDFWNMENVLAAEGTAHRAGDLADFFAQGYAAAWVAPANSDLALSSPCRPCLVLGGGREGTWIWPEVNSHVFCRERVTLRNSSAESGRA